MFFIYAFDLFGLQSLQSVYDLIFSLFWQNHFVYKSARRGVIWVHKLALILFSQLFLFACGIIRAINWLLKYDIYRKAFPSSCIRNGFYDIGAVCFQYGASGRNQNASVFQILCRVSRGAD